MKKHQSEDEQQYQNQDLTSAINEPPYQNTASLISSNNINNNNIEDEKVIGAGTGLTESSANNNVESINKINESSNLSSTTDTKLSNNNINISHNNVSNINNNNNLEELYDIPVGE